MSSARTTPSFDPQAWDQMSYGDQLSLLNGHLRERNAKAAAPILAHILSGILKKQDASIPLEKSRIRICCKILDYLMPDVFKQWEVMDILDLLNVTLKQMPKAPVGLSLQYALSYQFKLSHPNEGLTLNDEVKIFEAIRHKRRAKQLKTNSKMLETYKTKAVQAEPSQEWSNFQTGLNVTPHTYEYDIPDNAVTVGGNYDLIAPPSSVVQNAIEQMDIGSTLMSGLNTVTNAAQDVLEQISESAPLQSLSNFVYGMFSALPSSSSPLPGGYAMDGNGHYEPLDKQSSSSAKTGREFK